MAMELGKRHRLMDLIGKRTGVFHSAVFSCFAFDPVFFSSYYMPKLRSVGIRNVIVLMDARQYDKMAADLRAYGKGIQLGNGRGYTLVRQECSSVGVFHPKLSLFLGAKDALAFIGSGNLTYGGIAYNDEVWGAFQVNEINKTALPIIASLWRYFEPRLYATGIKAVQTQAKWIAEYCPWIQDLDSSSTFTDDDDIQFSFIANGLDGSIISFLKEAVGEETVNRISIVSPFYDVNGLALQSLVDIFSPRTIDCYIDVLCGISPYKIDDNLNSKCSFFKVDSSAQKIHAKIIQIECAKRTILAIGSANATTAALGTGSYYSNDEADILIQNPSCIDYLEILGLRKGAIPISELSGSPSTHSINLGSSHDIKVWIRSCEYNGELYHFTLDKPVSEAALVFINTEGEHLALESADYEECFEIPAFSQDGAISVYLSNGKEKISNDFIIIQSQEIIRSCPDKELCDQEAWIAAAIDSGVWHHYLEKILGSVTFDDSPNSPSFGFKSGPGNEVVIDAKEFSTEDFNTTHYTGEVNTRDLLSRNIKDYLSNALRIVEEDDDNEETEEASQTDIDRGNIQTRSEKKQAKRSIDDSPTAEKLLKKLESYLKRLYAFYGKICKEMDNAPDYLLLGRVASMGFFKAPRVVDYIHIQNAVLALSLMSTEEVISISDSSLAEIRNSFIKIVGRFFLIYRQEQEKNESLIDAREEFCSSVLMLVSHLNWVIDREIVRVLLFNLLELFHNDTDAIRSARRRFEVDMTTSTLTSNDDSLAFVFDSIESYIELCSLDKKTLRTEISTSWKYALVYKKSIGFHLFRGFDVNRTGIHPSDIPYYLMAYSPGFLEAKPIPVIHNRTVTLIENG